jgi:hypothetical protein
MFLALIGRPIFLLLKLALEPVLIRLWSFALKVVELLRRVVIPWLLKNGGEQVRHLLVALVDFHKQRTTAELLSLYAILLSFLMLYRLYRFVQHQRWVTRTEAFVRGHVAKLVEVSRTPLFPSRTKETRSLTTIPGALLHPDDGLFMDSQSHQHMVKPRTRSVARLLNKRAIAKNEITLTIHSLTHC